MATYNWAYKPGVTNKYNITIDASADNARPDNAVYVALFGNDNTGNGSREMPFRTITKALSIGGIYQIILGSGVYREAAILSAGICDYVKFYGDGDVKIDISYIGNTVAANYQHGGLYNMEIIGNGFSTFAANAAIGNNTCQDVVFNASFISPSSVDDTVLINCVVKNYSGSLYLSFYGANGGSAKNCTFVNINNFVLAQTDVSNGKVDSCVFQNCNISSSDQSTAGGEGKIGFTKFIYSLFFQCNFMLRGGVGNGGVVYPGVPAGYTAYTNIATLQADFRTAYGTNSFTGCNIADPLFNNYNIGDYSLQFNSPAKNLTYFGTYVGAKSIAYAVKASATEANGAFDFSTNINLTIADDSITLTDQTQNGEVKTNLIVNTAGRQIQRFPIYGFNADRNGQYIDSIPDLGTVYYTAGQAVNSNTPYLVEGAAITCNGNVYQVGDRLTIPTGVTAFTGDGTLREILEAPERHTIKMRCSDGLAAVANGAAAVAGYWYYVVSGNATYNGNVINAGSSFKAVDTNAIGVNGSVELAFDNTDTFQHYEPGIQPTTNNVGDVRKGEVLRGNGDPAYVRGGYGIQEFPVNPKYIQLYYIIRVSELTP